MTIAGTAGGALGGTAGQWAGGAVGGVLGSIIGPEGTIAGALIGRRLGGLAGSWAGRAAGEWAASHMSHANEEADKGAQAQTDSKKACATCNEVAIPCFNPPGGPNNPETNAEMDDQLQEQQDAINEMSPQEALDNMAKNRPGGGNLVRPDTDKSDRGSTQRSARNDRADDIQEGTGDYSRAGRTAARAQAKDELAGKVAPHLPDLAAGGSGRLGKALVDGSVNSSIGSQWNTNPSNPGQESRGEIVKKAAEEAKARGDKKMNVKLERCKPPTS